MAIYNPNFYRLWFIFKVLKFLNAILLFNKSVAFSLFIQRVVKPKDMNAHRFTNKTSTSPEGRRPPRWMKGKTKNKQTRVYQLFSLQKKWFLQIKITTDWLLCSHSLDCVHDVFMMYAETSRKKQTILNMLSAPKEILVSRLFWTHVACKCMCLPTAGGEHLAYLSGYVDHNEQQQSKDVGSSTYVLVVHAHPDSPLQTALLHSCLGMFCL